MKLELDVIGKGKVTIFDVERHEIKVELFSADTQKRCGTNICRLTDNLDVYDVNCSYEEMVKKIDAIKKPVFLLFNKENKENSEIITRLKEVINEPMRTVLEFDIVNDKNLYTVFNFDILLEKNQEKILEICHNFQLELISQMNSNT